MKPTTKHKKKKPHVPSLSNSEEVLVGSILQDFENTDPSKIIGRLSDPRIAEILIDRLPLKDSSPVPLLLALKEAFQDKHVQKAAKRAVFKLKNRGIPVDAFDTRESGPPTVVRPPAKEDSVAYLGPVDGFGSRAVVMELHRATQGVDMGIGFVSDEKGFQQFLFGTYSKKRAKQAKEHIPKQAGPLVETTISHAATVLESVYKRHQELQAESPTDYLELRPLLLEDVTLLQKPAIYEILSEDIASDTILTYSQLEKLFRHRFMESWLIDPDELRPFMTDIIKVGDSPIVLSETQKDDRIRQIKEKCMEELFPSPKRTLLKQRLEEMAYIFFKSGEEDYCKISLSAAHTLDKEDSILRKNTVIEFILERSLNWFMDRVRGMAAEEDKKVGSSQLILPP